MMDILNELGKFLTDYGTVGCLVLAIAGLVLQEKQRRKEREENKKTFENQEKSLAKVCMACSSAMKSFAAELRDFQQETGRAKKSISDYIPRDADIESILEDKQEE